MLSVYLKIFLLADICLVKANNSNFLNFNAFSLFENIPTCWRLFGKSKQFNFLNNAFSLFENIPTWWHLFGKSKQFKFLKF